MTNPDRGSNQIMAANNNAPRDSATCEPSRPALATAETGLDLHLVPANDNPGAGSHTPPAVVLTALVDLLAEICTARLTAANDNASPSFTD